MTRGKHKIETTNQHMWLQSQHFLSSYSSQLLDAVSLELFGGTPSFLLGHHPSWRRKHMPRIHPCLGIVGSVLYGTSAFPGLKMYKYEKHSSSALLVFAEVDMMSRETKWTLWRRWWIWLYSNRKWSQGSLENRCETRSKGKGIYPVEAKRAVYSVESGVVDPSKKRLKEFNDVELVRGSRGWDHSQGWPVRNALSFSTGFHLLSMFRVNKELISLRTNIEEMYVMWKKEVVQDQY